MTSTDTLLPCPFCGSQAAWPEPEVNMNYVQCMSCSATANHAGEWNRRTTPPPATDEPWEGPLTDKENAMLEAAWQKHKDAAPPTPATDEREAVARAICALHCTECGYTFKCDDGWREVLPDADAALLALAPIRAQEIAAARAEEQGYRHTQVAALKQVHAAEILAARTSGRNDATDEREAVAQWCSGCHEVRSVDCYRAGCPKSDTERRAAEILAAEANERARIVAWLDETAWLLERDYFGQLRYFSAACQDEAPTDWTPDNLQALRFARRIDAERFASREATDCIDIRVVEHMWCAIEHGEGK